MRAINKRQRKCKNNKCNKKLTKNIRRGRCYHDNNSFLSFDIINELSYRRIYDYFFKKKRTFLV